MIVAFLEKYSAAWLWNLKCESIIRRILAENQIVHVPNVVFFLSTIPFLRYVRRLTNVDRSWEGM